METSAHIKYLLANEQDNRWGVVVTTTGYQIIEPQTSYPPSNHPVRYLFSVEKGRLLNEYQLIYISRGDGQFVSASHKETSFEGGGKFILLFPGRVAQLPPLAQDRLARVLDRIHRPRHRPQGRREVPRPAPAAFQRRLSRGYHQSLQTGVAHGAGAGQRLPADSGRHRQPAAGIRLRRAHADRTRRHAGRRAAQRGEDHHAGQLQPQSLLPGGRRAHLHELLAVPPALPAVRRVRPGAISAGTENQQEQGAADQFGAHLPGDRLRERIRIPLAFQHRLQEEDGHHPQPVPRPDAGPVARRFPIRSICKGAVRIVCDSPNRTCTPLSDEPEPLRRTAGKRPRPYPAGLPAPLETVAATLRSTIRPPPGKSGAVCCRANPAISDVRGHTQRMHRQGNGSVSRRCFFRWKKDPDPS